MKKQRGLIRGKNFQDNLVFRETLHDVSTESCTRYAVLKNNEVSFISIHDYLLENYWYLLGSIFHILVKIILHQI